MRFQHSFTSPAPATRSTPLLACRRFSEAELYGTRTATRRRRRVVVPVLLRRLPARRGDRSLPAADEVGDRLRPARRSIARHLQRLSGAVQAGLLPARCCPSLAALRLPSGRPGGGAGRHSLHARVCGGGLLSVPSKRTRGRYYAPDSHRAVGVRYAPGQNPNGAQDDIAGVCNAKGNVIGLIRARARGRPAHRLRRPHPVVDRFPWPRSRDVGGSPAAPHRELGLTDAEYDGIVERLGAIPARSS